ncbi:Putative peptidoglycan binding domain protein [Synechococcus sp. PCC 7335]|uniref:peptidoglycan-binding protein n=1 Tax=Synechococcus sp. (strain ATCC 29403 / PCC 7335) TaxID=91464 RepID=UPI00017EC80B|nr:peptidoglycan-binding protein [Synechococcus sp. PCC 7335]EDX83527.1 Putative peptidoglycan binding domain protein [Synechococcus sp. PCC 7335]
MSEVALGANAMVSQSPNELEGTFDLFSNPFDQSSHLNLFGEPLSQPPQMMIKLEERSEALLSAIGSVSAAGVVARSGKPTTQTSFHGDEFVTQLPFIDTPVAVGAQFIQRGAQWFDRAAAAGTELATPLGYQAAQDISVVRNAWDSVIARWKAPDNPLRQAMTSQVAEAASEINYIVRKVQESGVVDQFRDRLEAVREQTTPWFERFLNRLEEVSGYTAIAEAEPLTGNDTSSKWLYQRAQVPFVGIIDNDFNSQAHGRQVADVIQQAGQQPPDWTAASVGTGDWATSLVDFVDAAKVFGRTNAIVNLSFDLTEVDSAGNLTTRFELTKEEKQALAYAQENSVLVVISSGNQAGKMSALGRAAQAFDNVIAVGAAKDGRRADYSSYGHGLTLVASGQGKEKMEGTSIAAARTTGAIAKIWNEQPQLSYRQVVQLLESTAIDLEKPGWDPETGHGQLNTSAALDFVTVASTLPSASPSNSSRQIQTQAITADRPNPVTDPPDLPTWQPDNSGRVPGERPNLNPRQADAKAGWTNVKNNRSKPSNPRQADAKAGWTNIKDNRPKPSNPRQADAKEGWTSRSKPTNPRSDKGLLTYRPGAEMISGNRVKQWQRAMRRQGYDIAVDGIYGPQSQSVARQFQRKKGLDTDGIVGPKTWAASLRSKPSNPRQADAKEGWTNIKDNRPKPSNPRQADAKEGWTSRSKPTNPRSDKGLLTYRPGAEMISGNRVKQWQRAMRRQGYDIAVDGIYGPQSQSVARQFQRKKGLDTDGIVGPKTWAASLRSKPSNPRQADAKEGWTNIKDNRPKPSNPRQADAKEGWTNIKDNQSKPSNFPRPSNPRQADAKEGWSSINALGERDNSPNSISEMDTNQRFTESLKRAASQLDDEIKEEFEAFLTPENIAIMAGTTALWAASHVTPAGWLVDGALIGMGVLSSGLEAIDAAKGFYNFASGTLNAKTESDLDAAGEQLAEAITIAGIGVVTGLLRKGLTSRRNNIGEGDNVNRRSNFADETGDKSSIEPTKGTKGQILDAKDVLDRLRIGVTEIDLERDLNNSGWVRMSGYQGKGSVIWTSPDLSESVRIRTPKGGKPKARVYNGPAGGWEGAIDRKGNGEQPLDLQGKPSGKAYTHHDLLP